MSAVSTGVSFEYVVRTMITTGVPLRSCSASVSDGRGIRDRRRSTTRVGRMSIAVNLSTRPAVIITPSSGRSITVPLVISIGSYECVSIIGSSFA